MKRNPVLRLDLAAVDGLRPWLGTAALKSIGALGHAGHKVPLLALSACVAAAGLAKRDTKLARTGTRMRLAHLLSIAIVETGKDNVARSRPGRWLKERRHDMRVGGSKDAKWRSFPSGQTAAAVALARAAARDYPGLAGLLYAAAGTVGALQVPRLAHFPSDVAAGAAVGAAAETAANAVLDRVVGEREKAS